MSPAEKIAAARRLRVPRGAVRIAPKGGGAEVWTYDAHGAPCAVAFIGRRTKPAWRLRFPCRDRRAEYIADLFRRVAEEEARKAKRNAPHTWEPGLILSASWGYDQTNVDFFEVTAVTAHTVTIEEIGHQVATDSTGHDMADKVVPDPEIRTGKITRHRVTGGSIKSPIHGFASPWNGKPCHRSWYA